MSRKPGPKPNQYKVLCVAGAYAQSIVIDKRRRRKAVIHINASVHVPSYTKPDQPLDQQIVELAKKWHCALIVRNAKYKLQEKRGARYYG